VKEYVTCCPKGGKHGQQEEGIRDINYDVPSHRREKHLC